MKTTETSIITAAEGLYAAGCCDAAVALLSERLAVEPARTGIRVKLIELLVDSERFERALEFLNQAGASTGPPSVLLLRAVCLEATGAPESAERIADQLIERNHLRAEALALKGRLALHSNQFASAEALFKQAIDCDGACAWAWFGLACTPSQGDKPTVRFELLRKAFLCSPETRRIAIAFHESCLSAQAFVQTEEAFRAVLSQRRLDRRLRFFLIDLLLRQAKQAEAMAEVESVLVDFGVDEGTLAAGLKLRDDLGPWHPAQPSRPGRRVSLCMIVKNEERHLARCLLRAKPVVDEIVVVDTGSTDRTKNIATAFGARVYDFIWVDDFSKARNFSLTQASGDWILVLDADEEISDRDHEAFKKILEESYTQPAAFRIQTRNYSNQVNTVGFRPNQGEYPEEKGMGWYPSDKVRLFPNDLRIRFDYPVHELVEPSLRRLNIPIFDGYVCIHHCGPINDKDTFEKTINYRKLADKKIKSYINDPGALKEAAIQSGRTGSHAEALKLWRRFIKVHPRSAEAYLNMGTACWHLGRHSEAFVYAQKAMELDPKLKEAKFNLALVALMMERAGEARQFLEELYRDYPDYPGAQFLLCVTYACLQMNAQAEVLFNELRALPIGEFLGESFLDIAQRFLAASRCEFARRVLETALRLGCDSDEIRTLVDGCDPAT